MSLIVDIVKFILQQHCICYFFQWIDGPEFYDDYLLEDGMSILMGPQPSETWRRLVRPPPSPPKYWKLDETTPKAPPLVWCEHCQDMTRWCPLYGPDTLEDSWKVFGAEQKKDEDELNKEKEVIREGWAERTRKFKIAKRKKEEEEARKKEEKREEKRRKEFDDSKAWLKKENTKWKLWKH